MSEGEKQRVRERKSVREKRVRETTSEWWDDE